MMWLFVAFEDTYCNEGYKQFEEDFRSHKDEDDDNSIEALSFQEIAKKMVDITPDGGIKKQTMIHGIGEVIPSGGYVVCKFFQNFMDLTLFCLKKEIIGVYWRFRDAGSAHGPRAFSVASPSLWNSLPDSLRYPDLGRDGFRCLLKTHLFTLY